MAHRIITNGPSKMDLMLARFDQEHHQTVTFQTACSAGGDPQSLEVAVIGDEDGFKSDTWRLVLLHYEMLPGGANIYNLFFVDYNTRTREGRMLDSVHPGVGDYWQYRVSDLRSAKEWRARNATAEPKESSRKT